MGQGVKSTGRAAGTEGGTGSDDSGEAKRLRKKFLDLNDKYVLELQEHKDDIERYREELQTLKEEQIRLREDVEIERTARIRAEKIASEGVDGMVLVRFDNVCH
eukprot:COSAG05_NODE_67_length_22197_cov_42.906417_7_plen_104_part_00